jgi:hypothetical protein
MKTPSLDNLLLSRDLNPNPSEYELGVPPTRQRHIFFEIIPKNIPRCHISCIQVQVQVLVCLATGP